MEKIDIDLNSLFNLSYNFENLKLLLTNISKNQDLFESKLNGIEERLNNLQLNPPKEEPEEKQEQPEKQEKPIFDNNNNIKIIRDYQRFKTKRERRSDFDDFNKKIIELENKIKLLYNFIPKFPDDKTKTLNSILDEYQLNIENNLNDIKEMKEKFEKVNGTVNDLSVKMNDIDIYSIMKDIQFSGGDIEASKILIQALERKTEAKFKFMEGKIKDDEQLAQKMKNEVTFIKNNCVIYKNNLQILREQIMKLSNEVDSNKRNTLESIKNNENEIENLKERENKNLESINNEFKNIKMNFFDYKGEGEFGDQKDKDEIKINNTVDSDIKKSEKDMIKETTKELVTESEKDKSEEKDKVDISVHKIDSSHFVNQNYFNDYKEATQKKFNSFERRIQAIISQMKNDYFQKELFSLKNTIDARKPTPQEFYDLSVQVQQYSDFYDNMKEENGNMKEEFKKLSDSVSTLLKNYEILMMKTSGFNLANTSGDNIKEKDKMTIISKLNDFVEISVFNEYIKEQTKFSEKIKKDLDSYRHFYDEIIETLKKAASVQDLKSLEEYLLDLFDEFKDRINRIYPKKSELNKNFKAIELQIKQLYEYIIKKDENSDNWLLAKKPIGGFSCASCESYLGDLKENNEKVLWNQLPEREIITTNNTNRIGNGFSRILNLVNVARKDNISPSKISKPDYASFKNELKDKNNDAIDETNSKLENSKYMNITMIKNGDEEKNTYKDYSTGNKTKTNISTKQKISFSPEDKFRLTTGDSMNIFREMKNKKSKNGLPPISMNKDDSNAKDMNFSSLFEDIKDKQDKDSIPKVMKIIRKKK